MSLLFRPSRRECHAPFAFRCRHLATILLCFLFVLPRAGVPCTTFVAETSGTLLFGRNLDWHTDSGALMVNPRGIEKTAYSRGDERPARWTSIHGSVTFNQVGREFPYGGMNEKGLVVECMWLPGTVYPASDGRPTVYECQWIQYQLDTAETVEQVIASDASIRISPDAAPLHFLVCDGAGRAATVEFLGGKTIVHTGDDLPVKALANTPYADSLAAYRAGRTAPPASSISRFCAAAAAVPTLSAAPGETPESLFRLLDAVAQGDLTKWRVVYDLRNRRIQFETKSSPKRKSLDAASLDYSTASGCRMVEVNVDVEGDVSTRLTAWSRDANVGLCERALRAMRPSGILRAFSDEDLKRLAWHPETPPSGKSGKSTK